MGIFQKFGSVIEAVTYFLYVIPCILIALTFHEFSHAFVASKLGDRSQAGYGRLSLNPLRHIDLFGMLMLIVVGFGWAKPVSVNMQNFKDPKKGMALTAIAGPISNFILMFVSLIIKAVLAILLVNGHITGVAWNSVYVMTQFFGILATINAGLGLFNLIPIPPLDGSRVLTLFLSNRAYYTLMQYERYGFLILMLLLLTNVINTPLSAAMNFLLHGSEQIISSFFSLFM